ncbi:MAG: hypothetical protein JKY52_06325 [Flavobacteriales bacterium]|nr:hypothetical protein [Flavobacteriales bacterium]
MRSIILFTFVILFSGLHSTAKVWVELSINYVLHGHDTLAPLGSYNKDVYKFSCFKQEKGHVAIFDSTHVSCTAKLIRADGDTRYKIQLSYFQSEGVKKNRIHKETVEFDFSSTDSISHSSIFGVSSPNRGRYGMTVNVIAVLNNAPHPRFQSKGDSSFVISCLQMTNIESTSLESEFLSAYKMMNQDSGIVYTYPGLSSPQPGLGDPPCLWTDEKHVKSFGLQRWVSISELELRGNWIYITLERKELRSNGVEIGFSVRYKVRPHLYSSDNNFKRIRVN